MAVVAQSLWRLYSNPPAIEWLVLAVLTLLTGSFTVKLPSLPAKLSVSEAFVFASALLFGPSAGTVTVVLDALVISFWMKSVRSTPAKLLFNITAPAIAMRVASECFFLLSGAQPGQIDREQIGLLLIPVFAFALLYFLVNTGLVALALAFDRNESPFKIWRANFPGVSITYFVGSSIAMFIVAYTDKLDLTALSIILPLLLVSYLTFRTSLGRVEDANRHVAHVNELYLSTIETLAMAVDAKDQITHGHIRRVQTYAVQLAKRLGIAEGEQLKAIEAAALLHDMGKLAIPEHILNKPGKLTAAEFEKMKRHAEIGADLLSSIRFPYPVVPIVRHHHENWNGTGYPSKLAGNDIPLGARILSVVDCFDALTSDRPYRPSLSTADAFAILRQRSGVMYDPLVVETFIQVYEQIAPAAVLAGQQARTLVPGFHQPSTDSGPFNDIRANAAQDSVLGESERALKHTQSLAEAVEVATQYIGILTPATTCALFRYSGDSDTLTCVLSKGDEDQLIVGLSMKNGERVTGWAVANETIIANSPAALDLCALAERFEPPMRSAIAVPLKRNGKLIGAWTAYSSQQEPFTDDHRYAMERIASAFADAAGLALGSSDESFASRRYSSH